MVEIEAGVLDDLRDRMARMHAREFEAPTASVEGEQATIRDERNGSARPINVARARARRAYEIDFLDQRARAVLEPEQDHLGHDVVEVRRAERAGKAHPRARVVADGDQVDVARAVDLSAGEEEHVDTALAGAVEEFAPAIGEETMSPAAQERYVGPPLAALTRQQRGGSRNWGGRTDRDVTGIADEASNDVSKQLLVAKRLQSVTRRVGHTRADRDKRQIHRRSRPYARSREDAPRPRRSDRQARAAKRLSAQPRLLRRTGRRGRRRRASGRRTDSPREVSP